MPKSPVAFIATERPGVVLIESRSKPGRFYTLTGFGTPLAACNCPGAFYSNGDCSHVKAAIALLAYADAGDGLVDPPACALREGNCSWVMAARSDHHFDGDLCTKHAREMMAKSRQAVTP